ncbi:MAG: CcdB family protein [Betaproteobacteria bacterium]|nr:CcdB family protein [Betaproteobacteria bacterium]
MPQFDVYRNVNPATRKRVPYLLDVQSDLLETLLTRIVVPLYRPDVTRGKAISRLNPVFAIDGKELVMLTPELAGVPRKSLGEKMGNLAPQRTEIVAALDLVCTGI